MKKFNAALLIPFSLLASSWNARADLAPSSPVDGPGASGGGNAVGQLFAATAEKVIDSLSELDPKIFTSSLVTQLKTTLAQDKFLASSGALSVTVQGKTQPCTAISQQSPPQTTVDPTSWCSLSPLAQNSIALHEILVVAGLESTGDYHLSAHYQVLEENSVDKEEYSPVILKLRANYESAALPGLDFLPNTTWKCVYFDAYMNSADQNSTEKWAFENMNDELIHEKNSNSYFVSDDSSKSMIGYVHLASENVNELRSLRMTPNGTLIGEASLSGDSKDSTRHYLPALSDSNRVANSYIVCQQSGPTGQFSGTLNISSSVITGANTGPSNESFTLNLNLDGGAVTGTLVAQNATFQFIGSMNGASMTVQLTSTNSNLGYSSSRNSDALTMAQMLTGTLFVDDDGAIGGSLTGQLGFNSGTLTVSLSATQGAPSVSNSTPAPSQTQTQATTGCPSGTSYTSGFGGGVCAPNSLSPCLPGMIPVQSGGATTCKMP